MTFRTPQRMELTGGCNLRDLGGHDTADGREVRRGVIYRSGVLSYLTPSDHNCIARAKISTIIDLRHSDEIAAEPTTWMLPVKRLSWPQDKLQAASQHKAPWDRWASVEDARGWMLDSYTAMHKRLAEPLKGIFRSILEGEIPILFHCSAGKDRTGFCAAIILGVIGVSEKTILDEFAFTNDAVDLHAFIKANRAAGMGVTDAEHPLDRMNPEVRQALLSADRVYLKAALDAVTEKYGSIEGYARKALGLDDDQLSIIRFQLLDD